MQIIRALYDELSDEWLTWTDVLFWFGLGFALGVFCAVTVF